MVTHKIPI